MNRSRGLLIAGIISLVLAGVFSTHPIVGLFIALTILFFVGSFNAAVGERE